MMKPAFEPSNTQSMVIDTGVAARARNDESGSVRAAAAKAEFLSSRRRDIGAR